MKYYNVKRDMFFGTCESRLQDIAEKAKIAVPELFFDFDPNKAYSKAKIASNEENSSPVIIYMDNGRVEMENKNGMNGCLVRLPGLKEDGYRGGLVKLYGGGEVRIYRENDLWHFEAIFL